MTVTRRARARRAEGGFTLIELMISLTVLTIALLGMLGLYRSASRGNQFARRFADAHALAVGRIESLRPLALAAITSSANLTLDVMDTGQVYHVRHVVETDVAGTPNLFRIRAEVSFAEDGDETELRTARLEVVRTTLEAL